MNLLEKWYKEKDIKKRCEITKELLAQEDLELPEEVLEFMVFSRTFGLLGGIPSERVCLT